MVPGGLTSTDLIAAASEILETGGYVRIEAAKTGSAISDARLYEDPYSVVALIVCETWAELESRWTDAQGALVELMSAHMSREDPKAWEGYLVLLTPGSTTGIEETQTVSSIRYDTSRVRKLVATGNELKQISDVERTLLPLLPLHATQITDDAGSVLDLLPQMLAAGEKIEEPMVRAVIDAFIVQKPLVEALDIYRLQA
jgi:hypothetical protein